MNTLVNGSFFLRRLYLAVFLSWLLVATALSGELEEKNCVQYLVSDFLINQQNPENAYLKPLIIAHINEQLNSIPQRKRKFILEALNNAQTTRLPNGVVGGVHKHTYHAELLLSPSIVKHPLSRIVLIHELKHILQFYSRSPLSKSLRKTEFLYSPERVMKEEAEAFAVEYNFIRKAYRPEDLPSLKQRYPVLDEESAKELLDLDADALSIESKLSKLEEFSYNKDFLTTLELALTLSEKEYVRHCLSTDGYKNQQEARYAKRNKVLLKLAGGISISTIVYSLLQGYGVIP